MARFVDAIDLPVPVEQAFDFLADFSHTAEWDPGVSHAERLDSGPLGVGSRFRVTLAFLGRQLEFVYEITVFERPRRLVLRGSDGNVLSLDELTLVARDGGTRLTYEARLELSGLQRSLDPLLHLLFQHIGRVAVRGLRERMARPDLRAPRPQPRPRRRAARGG